MRYEIECGHCGYRFIRDEHELARTIKCTVCGGLLTVAIPVPVVHEQPLSLDEELLPLAEPLPLPPEPVSRPRQRRPLRSLGDYKTEWLKSLILNPERRVLYLASPWPGIHWGLTLTRNAAVLALVLYVMAFGCNFFLPLLLPLNDRELMRNIFLVAVGLQLVPALMHLRGQVACRVVPSAYGGNLSASSTWVLLLLPALGVLLRDREVRALVVAGCAMVVACSAGLWLGFLSRLGQRLADDGLKGAVGRYAVWFGLGVITMLGLLAAAGMADPVDGDSLSWILKLVAAACGLLLLVGYRFVLDVAIQAVAGRAPIITDFK